MVSPSSMETSPLPGIFMRPATSGMKPLAQVFASFGSNTNLVCSSFPYRHDDGECLALHSKTGKLL